MRRLRNNRAPEPEESAIEGFDRLDMEGDAIGPVADEISWLRPLGADLTGPVLAGVELPGEPEAERIPREARELAALGRRLDAVLLLRRFLQEQPRQPEIRALLAELVAQGGDTEVALAELTIAIGEAGDAAAMLVLRGDLLS